MNEQGYSFVIHQRHNEQEGQYVIVRIGILRNKENTKKNKYTILLKLYKA